MVSELYTDNNRLQCKTPRNFPVTCFMEEMLSSFSSLVFSLPLIFCHTSVAASISHFLTTATKISCCSSKIKCLPFLSLALALCRSLSCWALLAWYVLFLSLLQKTLVAMRFLAKITSSCYTCWLSYFTLVCLWCGWTGCRLVGRLEIQSCDYQNLPDEFS